MPWILTQVTSKFINVTSGSDLTSKGRELAQHFDAQGTPIMIGISSMKTHYSNAQLFYYYVNILIQFECISDFEHEYLHTCWNFP